MVSREGPSGTDPVPIRRDSIVSIDAARQRLRTEPPPTSEEIREWREIRPQVLQMLLEWDQVRSLCPLANKIINGE